MIYGYCRISTPNQNIDRQVCNILRVYPDATIIKETFTGRCVQRPEWNKLFKKLLPGDTIIFDEVSRMSRSADEGSALYVTLYDMGIELIFLKEPHINTTTYKSILTSNKIDKVGTDLDFIIEGINNYLKILSAKQIRMAFEAAEKEADFIRERTKEGLRQAKANGVTLGRKEGSTVVSKKSIATKKIITKHAKVFGGSLTDMEVLKLCGCSRKSYYKYKRELMEGIE